MVPVRIDPTRPDPTRPTAPTEPHRSIDRYRSISIDPIDARFQRMHHPRVRVTDRMEPMHRYSSIDRTDIDRDAPILIGPVDRSIATATAGTRGARLTWMECADSRR